MPSSATSCRRWKALSARRRRSARSSGCRRARWPGHPVPGVLSPGAALAWEERPAPGPGQSRPVRRRGRAGAHHDWAREKLGCRRRGLASGLPREPRMALRSGDRATAARMSPCHACTVRLFPSLSPVNHRPDNDDAPAPSPLSSPAREHRAPCRGAGHPAGHASPARTGRGGTAGLGPAELRAVHGAGGPGARRWIAARPAARLSAPHRNGCGAARLPPRRQDRKARPVSRHATRMGACLVRSSRVELHGGATPDAEQPASGCAGAPRVGRGRKNPGRGVQTGGNRRAPGVRAPLIPPSGRPRASLRSGGSRGARGSNAPPPAGSAGGRRSPRAG